MHAGLILSFARIRQGGGCDRETSGRAPIERLRGERSAILEMRCTSQLYLSFLCQRKQHAHFALEYVLSTKSSQILVNSQEFSAGVGISWRGGLQLLTTPSVMQLVRVATRM